MQAKQVSGFSAAVAFLFVALTGCATTSPGKSPNQERVPANVPGQASASGSGGGATSTGATFQQPAPKAIDRDRLMNEIASLDGQIAGLEGAIAAAHARLMSYEAMTVAGKEGLVATAQLELFSFESQKFSLESRKYALESEMAEVR